MIDLGEGGLVSGSVDSREARNHGVVESDAIDVVQHCRLPNLTLLSKMGLAFS